MLNKRFIAVFYIATNSGRQEKQSTEIKYNVTVMYSRTASPRGSTVFVACTVMVLHL
jgi:hypothetical protein